jgi:hypothetical protein
MTNTLPFSISRLLVTFAAALWLLPGTAHAQNRIGGHFGTVLPLVTHARGDSSTIADDASVGFPTGVTVRTSNRVAFDLEVVPVIQNQPLGVSMTFHPGVLLGLDARTTVGMRMAFDVDRPSWGFTPLLNRGFASVGGRPLFAELVAPVRFQEDAAGTFTTIGLGVHLGFGF